MKNKNSGIGFSKFRVPGILIFLFCVIVSVQSQAQSFFYFQNKITNNDSSTLTYHTFLMVEPDGSATARIRYKDPATNDDRLMEISLIDSAVYIANDSNKYLMPVGETRLIAGMSDSGFFKPRFIFKKHTDSSEAYYLPYAAEILVCNKYWTAFEMIQNQQKTYDELREMKEFIAVFYKEDDPVYLFLTEKKTRATIEKRNEKLFLIVVANSNDPSIGVTSKKDFDNITGKFSTLAAEMGIQTIITTKILGDGFSKKAVEDALTKLNPGPIDIVIFYYSGHGFRYAEDRSRYPRMSFRTAINPSRIDNNLSVEDIYNRILKKGAKVTIVLSDCCNEDIGAAPRVGRNMLKTKGGLFATFNVENAKRLFFPLNRTSIIAGAADINQLATGNPDLGGFFTKFFMTELEKSLYTYSDFSPSWLRIFIQAKEKARYQALTALCGSNRCVQTTAFRVLPEF